MIDASTSLGELMQSPSMAPVSPNVPLRAVLSEAICAVPENIIRARFCQYVGLPNIVRLRNKFRGHKLIICGGGASIQDTLGRIRSAKKLSRKVCIAAVNKTHDWLIERGIVPDFGILCDPRYHVVDYMTPHPKTLYLLGMTLQPGVVEKFQAAGSSYAMWLPQTNPGDREFMIERFPPTKGYSHAFITGSSTIGLRSIPLGTVLGFEDFELHGFDSCFASADGFDKIQKLYAYAKPESTQEMRDINIEDPQDGTSFRCVSNNNMTNQADEFYSVLKKAETFTIDGKRHRQSITVTGDGVIPWIAYKCGRHLDMDGMRRKYGNYKSFDYRINLDHPQNKSKLKDAQHAAA